MVHILHEWEQINFEQLKGTILVVGASDVGKTTFAQYLYRKLRATSPHVAFLDGDPGQSSLGPPTTMTLALDIQGEDPFIPKNQVRRFFVGATSPVGHMLPVVVGASKLVQAAYEAGAHKIVYDTSGLVDPARGGGCLKLSIINLLRPAVLFAIQETNELEFLLGPLRRSQRVHMVDLRPSPAASPRNPSTRKAFRAKKISQYFKTAHETTVNFSAVAVFPAPDFTVNRLVALEDENGFTLGLGIVREIKIESGQVILLTPVESMDKVDAINLGDVVLDPLTFQDQPVM